ncbi:unnamed protein product [Urochloa decumbens]|uniref:Uncharacterized protein n=1 Tax=Urochloa decumbens TaxID=240449 RepID=A0ABC9GAL7_9POAL
MVISAVVQEAVTRVSSLVFSKCRDMAPEAHTIERVEMALAELEFALERSAKLPITDVSLLNRRKVFKGAYIEGVDLLNKYRRLAMQAQEETCSQVVKRKRWITRAKVLLIATSVGLNKQGDVRRLEWFADRARRFLRDLECGCSLLHYTFCNLLVRHLLEGKSLTYEMVQASCRRRLFISPMCFEERGIEAKLAYYYKNRMRPEKSFRLGSILRLSETIDIVGTLIDCLRLLTSQFKIVAESAIGELTLLANFQDSNHSYLSQPRMITESDAEFTQSLRRDPLCCEADGQRPFTTKTTSSSEPSYKFPNQPYKLPDQVNLIYFQCYVSAHEYNLHSSTDEMCRNAGADWRSPLELTTCFTPHIFPQDRQEIYAVEVIEGKKERRDVSVEQMAEVVRSRAISSLIHQSEARKYEMFMFYGHAAAYILLKKWRTEIGRLVEPKIKSKTRRVAKRRRRN